MNVSSVVLFDALSSRNNQKHMIANITIRLFPLFNSWSSSPIFQLLQIRQSICIFKRLILLFRFFICSSGLDSSEFPIFSNCSSVSAFFVFFSGSFFICFRLWGFCHGLKYKKDKNSDFIVFFAFLCIVPLFTS